MTVPTPENYQLLRLLGRGGMGEVHLARDERLGREVAVKFLAEDLVEVDEFRSRFEGEARSAAGLSHPGIVTIHAIGEVAGRPFIAMEYVEGKTLRQAIPPDGLALPRLLDLGCQLAEAVAAAHEAGLTHRDLKPENVMLTRDDRVKVLDFGLAKRSDAPPDREEAAPIDERPTRAHLTAAHEVLGTPEYMSPEQAEGRPVDGRSDVFSLGVILYQMATGALPFRGESTVSTLTSILRDEPKPLAELRASLPPELWHVVRRCLEKNVQRRFQTARDVANELADLRDGREATGTASPARSATSGWAPARTVTFSIACLVGLALGAALGPFTAARLRPSAVTERSALRVGAVRQLTTDVGLELFPSLMANASAVAYASRKDGQWDIELLRVGGRNAIVLTEGETADDTQPALSPDGQQIAFRSERSGGGLFVMGSTGESVRRLTDFGFNPSWSPDGRRLVFATETTTLPFSRKSGSRLYSVSLDGGEAQLLGEQDAVQPAWSPNGFRIAYWGLGVGAGNRDLYTIPAAGGAPVRVTDVAATDWSPAWSADGRSLLFCSDRGGSMSIWGVPIDEETGELLGEPRPVTTGSSSSQIQPSLAADGTAMVVVSRSSRSNVERFAFDPERGQAMGEAVRVTAGSIPFGRPDPSPDGRQVVFARTEGQEDLFASRSDGSRRTQLTDDDYKDRIPRWSPVDERIAFFSNRGGSYDIWLVNADGSGLRQLTESPGVASIEPLWSPDGTRIGFLDTDKAGFAIVSTGLPPSQPQLIDKTTLDGDWFLPHDWAPDDRLVGTTADSDGAALGLGLYDLKDSSFRRLRATGDLPVWLDADRLLFLEGGGLHLLELSDGATRPVWEPAAPSSLLHFALSPDRTELFVTRLEEEADLWLFELEPASN